MKRLIGAIAIVLATAGHAAAQDAPKTQGAPVAAADAAAVPQVSDDAKRAIDALQRRAAGLAEAMAVLQKELDSVTADFSRLVQRLQVPEYELRPDLTYAKKAPADKKDPPK